MKKIVLVVVGIVAVGAVVLISRERAHRTQEEGTSKEETSVDSVSSSAAARRLGLQAGGEKEFETTEYTEDTEGESEKSADGQTGKSAPRLSEAVKALLGQDGKKHNYLSLLAAINALDADMSAADVAALREMLNFPNDRFPEKMRPIEINAVKNDVLDKLLRQKDLPEGLGMQMVEMAGNAENDPVWRDYCIQFMTPVYERLTTAKRSEIISGTEIKTEGNGSYTEYTEGGSSVNSVSSSVAGGEKDELATVRDAMFSALDERGETLAGTALIGLELLSRTHDEFDREVIVGKATEIAGDEMVSSASRLTALRLAAMTDDLTTKNTKDTKIVEAARSLAQTGETVLLRSAAIVTLGEVGTEADRELLESYVESDNRQIAAAAIMALEKMDQDPSVEPVVASKTISEPQVTEKLPPVLINQDI